MTTESITVLYGKSEIIIRKLKELGNVYCPVCGFRLTYELVPGHICNCCGYEYDVDDYITIEEIEMLKKYDKIISNSLRSKIMDLNIDREKGLPIDIAQEILRIKWIKGGCKWHSKNKNGMPHNWSLKMAEEQLKNINIDIKDYLKETTGSGFTNSQNTK
ncbi:hypothetical protein [Caloranaerobacter sp. DY30410]|uniref:hypothetical protein n=1 Tax=Caloranaerobacter sp. DY30410 TaxID=3238305 RepID=UPI003D025906